MSSRVWPCRYGNSSTPTGDTDVHLYFPFESAIKVSPLDKYALETNEIKYNFRIETALKSFDVEAADEKERNDWIMVRVDFFCQCCNAITSQ